MKNWKITLLLNNEKLEVTLEAKSYSEAYIKAEIKYPGCTIKSVSEIR